jgi:hypothetical protein
MKIEIEIECGSKLQRKFIDGSVIKCLYFFKEFFENRHKKNRFNIKIEEVAINID